MAFTFDSMQKYLLDMSSRQNDSNLIAQLPNIIYLAQMDILQKLITVPTEAVVTGNLDYGTNIILKPLTNIKPIAFTIYNPNQSDSLVTLRKRDYSYLNMYSTSRLITGVPKFYADFSDQTYIISPSPAVIDPNDLSIKYQMILKYHMQFQPLDENTQTNNLTFYYPNILITAASYFMWTQLQTPSLADKAQMDYEKMIVSANAIAQDARGDSSSNASKI